jgi:hypothetical protein
MKDKKQSIGIVMAAAMAALLLAGTILAPTHASAVSKFNTTNNTDASSLKHAIRDGISVSLEHRSQHMDQENICYRSDVCRQSNVGQNTLGNDNSVTGFADQSDNNSTAPATNSTTG